MTIRVKSFQAAAAAVVAPVAGPTDYAETFLRGDQAFSLGNDWFDVFSTSSTVGTSENGMVGLVNVSASGVTFGNVAGVVTRVSFFPVPLDHKEVRRKAALTGLFAKWTHVVDGGGAACDVGPFVFGDANRGNEYCLNRSRGGAVTLYTNLSDGSGVAPAGVLTPFTIAPGDEMEIRVIPSAPSNAVQCIKNGSLVATYTDSAAGRPTGGLYGIHFFGTGGTAQQTFKNFSGGCL